MTYINSFTDCFVDKRQRTFVPYKGWLVLNEDGTTSPDPYMQEPVGPFRQIPDPLGHGNWHTLTNLVTPDGRKLLSKGVREVTFYAGGYYLLYDDNEDELLNKGDVKGGFYVKDFKSRMNVLRSDGSQLSEDWFDTVEPCGNGLFKVTKGEDESVMDLSGNFRDYPLSRKTGNFKLSQGFEYSIDDGRISVFDSLGNTIVSDCHAMMWVAGRLWKVTLIYEGKMTQFFYGDGDAIVSYSHELLNNVNWIALVEVDGVWHRLSFDGQLTPVFRWSFE